MVASRPDHKPHKGLLSWPEVCAKLPNPSNANKKGSDDPLLKVAEPTKRYRSYEYRLSDYDGEWVSFVTAIDQNLKLRRMEGFFFRCFQSNKCLRKI